MLRGLGLGERGRKEGLSEVTLKRATDLRKEPAQGRAFQAKAGAKALSLDQGLLF